VFVAVFVAVSRTVPCCDTLCGGLQDRIHEHAQEFLDLMASDDCIFYFCGLKRMYSSVLDMLEVRVLFYLYCFGCLLNK
jgi:Na+-transporting NADH:ubiquinone oxidoreductase subunit NqrF